MFAVTLLLVELKTHRNTVKDVLKEFYKNRGWV